MLDVEIKIHDFADRNCSLSIKNLQTSQNSDRSKDEVAQLDAMNLGIFLSPHSMREMKDTSLKSCSGSKWKNIILILLTQVVEEWVLINHFD